MINGHTTEAKPKRVTLNNLNEYLQSQLPNLELVKGKEYFYFADLPNAPTSKLPDSIQRAKLGTNWKSWISDLDDAVAQWNKENAPVAV